MEALLVGFLALYLTIVSLSIAEDYCKICSRILKKLQDFHISNLTLYFWNLLKEHWERVLTFLAIIFVPPFAFGSLISKKLNYYWVDKFASTLEEGLVVDIAIMIVGGLLIRRYWLRWNNRYQIADNIFFIVLVISGWYIIAFFSGIWEFKTFTILPCIPYTHTFYIVSFGSMILWFCHHSRVCKLQIKKNEEPKISKGFLLDSPLTENGIDDYKRQGFIDSLANKIEHTSDNEQSFAIGIVGAWGSGKTSLMKRLKGRLKKRTENPPIIIEFNPWQSNSADAIIDSFFQQLSKELSEYNGKLSGQIHSYASKLLSVDENIITKISKIGLEFFNDSDSDALFDSINETISLLDRQLIIFIDDVDRLDKDEVIEVVRLIRNTANFGNTIFIVAYDRNYVLHAIKAINEYRSEAFLEKIFQLEISLPTYKATVINDYIYQKLSEQLPENFQKQINDITNKHRDFIKIRDFSYLSIVITIRDANRLLNSFLLILKRFIDEKGNSEVDLEDLFLLEVLRLKFPSVYDILGKDPNDWLINNSGRYELRMKNEKLSQPIIIEYLENNDELLCISQVDIPNIEEILSWLFTRDSNHLYTLTSPIHFDKYFAYRLLNEHSSIIEFARHREKPQSEFNNWIDEVLLQGPKAQRGLEEHFENIAFKNQEDYEKCIRAYFYLGQRTTAANNYYSVSKENILDLLDTKYGESVYKTSDAHKEFIVKLFEDAASPFLLESYLLRNESGVNATFPRTGFPLSDDEKFQFLSSYLKKYVSNNNYSKTVDWLLYACRTTHNNSSFPYPQEIINLMKDYWVSDNMIALISQQIRKEITFDAHRFKFKTDFKIIQDIYGSLEDFKVKLEALNASSPNAAFREAIEFIGRYSESSDDSIIFDFKILKVEE